MAEKDGGATLQEIFLRFSPLYEDYVIVVYLVAGAVIFLAEWTGIIQIAAFVLLAIMGFYSFFAFKEIAADQNGVWAKSFVGLSIASIVLALGLFITIFSPLTLRALIAIAFLANAGVHYTLDGDIELPKVAMSEFKIPDIRVHLPSISLWGYVLAVTLGMYIYAFTVDPIAQAFRRFFGSRIEPGVLFFAALLSIGLFISRIWRKKPQEKKQTRSRKSSSTRAGKDKKNG